MRHFNIRIDIRFFAGPVLAALLTAVPHTRALAQPQELLPITSLEGLQTVVDLARAEFADDSRILLAGAVGNAVFNGVELRFDPATGRSSAWAYLFSSDSRSARRMFAVFEIPGGGMQAMEVESPIEIPADVTAPVDLALTHAASNRMMERLRADTTYIRYTRQYPTLLPEALAFRAVLDADVTILPEDFPVDAALWNISYKAKDGSAMFCYVAGGTGRTHCVTTNATSAAPAGTEATTGTLITAPNPVNGRLRITVVPPAGGTGNELRVDLYDSSGRPVIERIEGTTSGGTWTAEIDTTELPHGAYHLRATRGPWTRSTTVLH